MVCPFRVDIDFEYCEINENVMMAAQKETFPECMEGECPYYDWNGSCKRVEED